MYEQTILLVMFVFVFAAMSVIFALAGLAGYTAPKREPWERAVSLGLGLLCSAGMARLAYESAGRI